VANVALDLVRRATGVQDCGCWQLARRCYQGVVEIEPHVDTVSRHGVAAAAGKARARKTSGAQVKHKKRTESKKLTTSLFAMTCSGSITEKYTTTTLFCASS